METLLFPSSPPSSPSSPSIVATLPFVPDADRTTAPGRAENRPGCAVQPVGYQILIGDLPLAPHRVAIPGTVPFRNRVASSDADPFPRRTGSQDLVLPPAPCRPTLGRRRGERRVGRVSLPSRAGADLIRE